MGSGTPFWVTSQRHEFLEIRQYMEGYESMFSEVLAS